MIFTKKAAKAAVSALRRELKDLPRMADALSHSEVQQVLARALGFKNWNAWAAMLADDPSKYDAPVAPRQSARYPLENDVSLDFVPADEEGTAFAPSLVPLDGTYQRLYAIGEIDTVVRQADGSLEHEAAVDSDVDWNNPDTLAGADGRTLWVTDDWSSLRCKALNALSVFSWRPATA